MSYGKELILGIHHCDVETFTEDSIRGWFAEVCKATDMVPREVHFWEEHGSDEPHLDGITAVQFIQTSSITIHASLANNGARINVFTCKEFDPYAVTTMTVNWFGGMCVQEEVLTRL